jgi:alkylation response protein AidB-like acyl-CoA dehydrogenase
MGVELAVVETSSLRDDAQTIGTLKSRQNTIVRPEVAGRVVDRCIQILGGMGVAQELPLERWYREMRIKRIGEGPSEVHRMVVARDMLGTKRQA